jgi:hypothetical protein
MTDVFTGADVFATRKGQKISREKFAEQVGLTHTKLYNIEKGRPMKPEEYQALAPYVTPGAAQVEGAPQPPGPKTAPQPAPTPPPAAADPNDVHALTEDELEDQLIDPGDVIACEVDQSDPNGLTCRCGHVATTPNKLASHIGIISGGEADPTPPPPPVAEAGAVTPPAAPASVVVPDGVFAATNSELRTYKDCRRRWYISYYLRLALPAAGFTGVRSVGTRVHAALEAMYPPAGETPENPLVALERVIETDLELFRATNPMPDQLDTFTKEADLCRAMIEGYIEWLAETGADQFIEVIAPEEKVLVPIDMVGPQGEVVMLLGKLDVRIRRTNDGARLFMDHKTVGNLTTPTRTLHMDEQMMHYNLLEYLQLLQAGGTGERSDGGLYNMLRKVKRTARATPPFYDRVEVRHSVEVLRQYYTRVIGEITDLLETKKKLDEGQPRNLVAYPHPTNDCTWKCDFFHICPMFDDGSRVDDYMRENLIQIDPHQRYEIDTDSTNTQEQ